MTVDEFDRVPVGLGERSYEVLIGPGLLGRAGELIDAALGAGRRLIVVADETVAALHFERLQQGLGRPVELLTVTPGEPSKSWAGLSDLVDRILALRVDRGSVILALGGGVIGDLAGFAAAIILRGIDFVQLPTSLLAQVDSSVGGKTAINTPQGKNLVGSFHQPRLVLADIDCLATLPGRHRRSGYAEVVKHGAIGDAEEFGWMEAGGGAAVMAGDPAAARRAVTFSCRYKAAVVEADEREGGARALLNFGHTFGHAYEAETGFSEVLFHGEGVALGMVLASRLSVRLGLCPAEDAARLERHLAASDLPVSARGLQGAPFKAERLLHHMAFDKKVRDGRLTFVLTRGLGSAFVSRDVVADQVEAVLATA